MIIFLVIFFSSLNILFLSLFLCTHTYTQKKNLCTQVAEKNIQPKLGKHQLYHYQGSVTVDLNVITNLYSPAFVFFSLVLVVKQEEAFLQLGR